MNICDSSEKEERDLAALSVRIHATWVRTRVLWPIRLVLLVVLVIYLYAAYIMISSGTIKFVHVAPAWAIISIFFFRIIRMEKKYLNQSVSFREDGTIMVDFGFQSGLIQKTDAPIPLMRSKNGKVWVIGKGRNITCVRKASVPVAAFPTLDDAYRQAAKFWPSAYTNIEIEAAREETNG